MSHAVKPYSPLLGLLFPRPCLKCGEGDQPCCRSCLPRSKPQLSELSGLPKVVGANYLEVRDFLLPYKDDGLLSVERVLLPIVTDTLLFARANLLGLRLIDQNEKLELVFPPSSQTNLKKRGFNPAQRLLRKAAPRESYRVTAALRLVRSTSDQGRLDAVERSRNLAGAMEARGRTSASILIFDDVTATGSTLREMHRALTSAGNRVLGYCALAESFLKRDPTDAQRV